MKNKRAALGLFAILTLAGCASLEVQTDYDPQAPFAQLSPTIGPSSWERTRPWPSVLRLDKTENDLTLAEISCHKTLTPAL